MTAFSGDSTRLGADKASVLDMNAPSTSPASFIRTRRYGRQRAIQFYNTSKFTLRDLRARTSQRQLKADFEAYLDGFSPNVQDILEKFEFRNQIPVSKADALGTLIEKLLHQRSTLVPIQSEWRRLGQKGIFDNHGMGTIFEELVRRFNEENNEEAGEH
jgi:type I restriction enzyme M protein